MSIQFRLNILIGLLLILALAGMVSAIVFDAQPRTTAEAASISQLTQTVIATSLARLTHSAEPERALSALVDELKTLRHVTVTLASRQVQEGTRMIRERNGFLFGIQVDGSSAPLKIPFIVSDRLLDTVIITPTPSDEISEIWDAAKRIVEYGLIAGLALFGLTSLVINRALRPIESLRLAMQHLEQGDFGVKVPVSGPPEFMRICNGLNTLASKLLTTREENQRLTTNMIHVQDSERREIARELHDELGPYLFSMRTTASVLSRELEKSSPDPEKSQRLSREISAQVDSLQQTNRRVLQRLTPAGLQELGLKGALMAIVAMWRKDQPDTRLTLDISNNIDNFEVATELTVYRVVQEGLTNCFRHSDASQISVHVSLVQRDAIAAITPGIAALNHPTLVNVSVRDNGRGLTWPAADGFGLASMRERVSALGGLISIGPAHGGGTLIDVYLPVAMTA